MSNASNLSITSAPAARLKRVSRVVASYAALPVLITLPQQSNSKLVLGRGTDADILLTSSTYPNMISRNHCTITVDYNTNKHIIIDNGSKNGTFINDIRIDKHELMNGDLITFGGSDKIKIGQHFAQPQSEFIYKYITDANFNINNNNNNTNNNSKEDDETDSAFDTMKSITENINVVFTWITTLLIAGSYLFAEENSEEYSYIRDYIKPLFDFIHLPFNRITFISSFVITMCITVWICFKIWGPKSKKKKN